MTVENPPQPNSEGRKRIAILSDMHDAEKIPEKVEEMREVGADINISIGDVFDSNIRTELIDRFKKGADSAIEELSEEERVLFSNLLESGQTAIRAYWMAKLQHNPELLRGIKVEIDEAFAIFAEYFESLPNAKWLFGNIEQSYALNSDFSESKIALEVLNNIEKIDQPQVFYDDEQTIGILFPSLPRDESTTEKVRSFFEDVKKKMEGKQDLRNVLIIAHEYLFHGPRPEKFKEKMEEASIDEYMVPFYLPNNYRKELLNFIFEVPEEASVKFVYGHIHDEKTVTQKAVAFRDSSDGLGMRWGVNKRDGNGGRRTREFDMYQLPMQSITTIDIEGGKLAVNSIGNGK